MKSWPLIGVCLMEDLGKVTSVPPSPRLRLVVFGVITIIVFGVLLSRLWFLQVLSGQEYALLAENNRARLVSVEAPRGIIYDRAGRVLVDNRPSPAVTLVPEVAERRPQVVKDLAEALEMTPDEVLSAVREKRADPLKPRVIKEDVDEETLAYIAEHQTDFPGVRIEVQARRNYPHGELGAHVLGYLGEISEEEMDSEADGYELGDLIGKAGVEKTYENVLRGDKGFRRIEVNAEGEPQKVLSVKEPRPGQNLRLNIDLEIQKAAQESLERAILATRKDGYRNAEAAAAVVLDPQNGEVLALASFPLYEPLSFVGGISETEWKMLNSKDASFPLYNRAISAYPPGSTFKPLVAVAGVAEDIISPRTVFDCKGTWYGLGRRWPKSDWKRSGHGRVNLREAIVESCDIYFYNLGHRFYKEPGEGLQSWSRKFGLGATTEVDLPTEARGRVPTQAWKKEFNKERDPENVSWYPGDTVNLAIGQGDMLVTPLQLARAYGAIANGGVLWQPRVAQARLGGDNVVDEFLPQKQSELQVSKDLLKRLRGYMREVVTSGTARGVFAGLPASVAGKTGTAEVQGKDDYAWFVGFAPVDEPEYVAVVLVEQGGHGGSVAAPAVRGILSQIYDVPLEVPKVTDHSR